MKDKSTEDRKKNMHVRLTQHDFERIKFAAEDEGRTISNFVRFVVMRHLDSFKA